MAFQLTWEKRANTFGVDERVVVLADANIASKFGRRSD